MAPTATIWLWTEISEQRIEESTAFWKTEYLIGANNEYATVCDT